MSFAKATRALMVSLAAAVTACLVSLTVLANPAEAQNRRAECNKYAREAVRQNEINERRDCGFDGSRWSDNRIAHFGWCMIFPRQAEKESDVRDDMLAECRGKRRDQRAGRRASCDTYAKIAVVQARANKKFDCDYRGGEWMTRERAHFRWCMRAKRKYLVDEIRYRAIELQKCFNRLGDDDEDTEDRGYRRRRFR